MEKIPTDYNSENPAKKYQDPIFEKRMNRREILKGLAYTTAGALVAASGLRAVNIYNDNKKEQKNSSEAIETEIRKQIDELNGDVKFLEDNMDSQYYIDRYEPGEGAVQGALIIEDDADSLRKRITEYREKVNFFTEKSNQKDFAAIMPDELSKMSIDIFRDRHKLMTWMKRK